MKKITWLFLGFFILMIPEAYACGIRNIQDNCKITYSIINTSGDHVSGQTPTIQIQRISDGFWLDFNDSTFKSSGWTNKRTTLAEDSTNGFYHYTYNPPASETDVEQYVFVVDNPDSTYGDHQAFSVAYQNIGSGTSTLTASNVWSAGTRTLTALDEDDTAIDLNSIAVGSVSGNVGGNVAGSVASVTAGVTVTTNNDKTGYRLSSTGVDDIWDEAISGHLTAGTTGNKLNAASAAGDPWATELPGSYTGSEAGFYLQDLIKKSRGR